MFVQFAKRTVARSMPRPQTVEARNGLSYEKKFFRCLREATCGRKEWLAVEHNPWFAYRTLGAEKVCCPDMIAFDFEEQFAVVIEVKKTFVPNAMEKLKGLYCPVVSRALSIPCKPLVVCCSLTPAAPNPSSRIAFALTSAYPLYQWLGTEPVLF